MPKIFSSPGEEPPQRNMTFYRVFVGPGTAFERDGLNLKMGFPDGLENTIAVIEAGEAVPWTKSDELEYHPEKPLPPLGGIFRGGSWLDRRRDRWDGYQAAMMDGSVLTFPRDFDEGKLRAFITRNGNDKVEKP